MQIPWDRISSLTKERNLGKTYTKQSIQIILFLVAKILKNYNKTVLKENQVTKFNLSQKH